MDLQQVKIYLERKHATYIDMSTEHLKEYRSEANDNKIIKDFLFKKATEYSNKADAILQIIRFINEEELNNL